MGAWHEGEVLLACCDCVWIISLHSQSQFFSSTWHQAFTAPLFVAMVYRLSDLSPLLTKDFHSWLIAFFATVTSCYLRHHLISSPTSLPPSTPSLLTGITPWRTIKHRCFFQACLHFLFFSLPSTLTLLSALKISSSHIRFSNPVAIALIFYCSIFTSYPDFP